jgi:hypothetical protein
MKPLFQIVAAMMLMLFFGVSGAGCLVPDARMSVAEKACCQQMAGQCDMSMAAKHPCCQKMTQRHDDADLKDLSHLLNSTSSLQTAILEPAFYFPVSIGFSVRFEQSEFPLHDPPDTSVTILRI